MVADLLRPLGAFALTALRRLAVSAAFGLSLASQIVSADTITFQITDGDLKAYQGAYADVTVTLTSSTEATIEFTSLSGSSANCGAAGGYYLMGDGGSVAVNVNADSFTVSDISGTNSLTGFSPWALVSTSSGNEDGLGTYNLKINSFDGWTHSTDTITFTLTDSSGTWASASDRLAANSKGYDAAIHFFPCIQDSTGTGCTSDSPGAQGIAGTGYAAGTDRKST